VFFEWKMEDSGAGRRLVGRQRRRTVKGDEQMSDEQLDQVDRADDEEGDDVEAHQMDQVDQMDQIERAAAAPDLDQMD
jgi:hypothetical protein